MSEDTKLCLISFSRTDPRADYAPLENSLRGRGAKQAFTGTWVLRTAVAHTRLRDELRWLLPGPDGLVVATVDGRIACHHGSSELAVLAVCE